MAPTARGAFEVKLTRRGAATVSDGVSLGAMAIRKRFRGPLDARGLGRMLTASTPVEGSAGYVAVERVVGKLGRRRGSFVLQHSGRMDRGAPELRITVVPDSGTGALEGLAGTMEIRIAGGKHTYLFRYTLPPKASRSG